MCSFATMSVAGASNRWATPLRTIASHAAGSPPPTATGIQHAVVPIVECDALHERGEVQGRPIEIRIPPQRGKRASELAVLVLGNDHGASLGAKHELGETRRQPRSRWAEYSIGGVGASRQRTSRSKPSAARRSADTRIPCDHQRAFREMRHYSTGRQKPYDILARTCRNAQPRTLTVGALVR